MCAAGKKERSEQTRRKIIAAAAEIFAREGYGGARVDEIAALAGVNKATLYYHIGDKDALYAEMSHAMFSDFAASVFAAAKSCTDPEERLRIIIHSFAEGVEGHAHMASIFMREISSGAQHLPEQITKDLLSLFGLSMATLKEGVAAGIFEDVNPFVVHMLIVSTLMMLKATGPVRRQMKDLPEPIKEINEDIAGYVADELERILLKALRK